MTFSFRPYTLQLKHPFTLGNNTSRTSTPIMLVELKHEQWTGIGEAAMPPYLGESHETASTFFSSLDFSSFNDPEDVEKILDYVDGVAPGNCAAKAAIDIALHDLIGKMRGIPCYRMFNVNRSENKETACTIGIDTREKMKMKVAEASSFHYLKIKLGTDHDKELIETIRSVSEKPLYVDVNQGWKNKEEALDMIYWLAEKNVLFIEQPFSKSNPEDAYWLFERSPLPIIADEACQRLSDIEKVKDCFHGINIKLMKCTGLHEAQKMLAKAREYQLKTMIGCMTETSCATLAALSIAPLFDYIDLDGPWLINNNPFQNPELKDGKIMLNENPGLGLAPSI